MPEYYKTKYLKITVLNEYKDKWSFIAEAYRGKSCFKISLSVCYKAKHSFMIWFSKYANMCLHSDEKNLSPNLNMQTNICSNIIINYHKIEIN